MSVVTRLCNRCIEEEKRYVVHNCISVSNCSGLVFFVLSVR